MSINLLKSLSEAVLHLINTSGADPDTKNTFSTSIQNGLDALKETAGAQVPTIESAVGVAVESTADAAITSAVGPVLSPVAVAAANRLLNALGGNVGDAIAHLLHAKGIVPSPANPVTVTVTKPLA